MKIINPISIKDVNLTYSSIPEADYTPFNFSSTYGLGDRSIVVSANTHQIWESIQGGNTGHIPVGGTSDLWWVYVGTTNKWSMFDTSLTTQSSKLDEITVGINSLVRVDSVALMNVSASFARIVMTDPVDGVVYDKTTNLVQTGLISDWWSFFFSPIVRLKDFLASDLPPYSSANISITLTAIGNEVKCGACVLGMSREIGNVQYGAKAGIQDYSVKQRDTFGNYSILERAFNKYSDVTLEVENTFIDEFQAIMADYRATPIIYSGSDTYNSLLIYGFYKDFSVVISYPTISICSMTLEGLT